MSQEMIGRLTNHLKHALTRALCAAVELDQAHIEPSHLLWAVGTQEGCIAKEILQKQKLGEIELEQFIGLKKSIQGAPNNCEHFLPALSEASRTVLEKAIHTANKYEHHFVGTEHVLASLLQGQQNDIAGFFSSRGANTDTLHRQLESIFEATAHFPKIAAQKELGIHLETEEGAQDHPGALELFAFELTQPEYAKTIDPVIGREQELARIVQILSRRTKNNPVLVGEPGVGKTAIVEGLAKRIVANAVPAPLQGKKLFRVDLASLLAGTMYRGEFEARLRQLIDEVEEDENVILFIDELHSITGAGAATGSLDAANILKPALARGTIRCIGATTPAEYKQTIEKDGALDRRFQSVPVREPSKEAMVRILEGLLPSYEKYHTVSYKPNTIRQAIELSRRYLPHKHFPDKAIDLLDEAGALTNVGRKKSAKGQKISVTEQHLLRVLSQMLDMPLQELSGRERKQLSGMQARLKRKIIGQESAVDQAVHALQRAKLGLSKEHQPLSSLLFIGPSGVGKTALAKLIAEEYFRHDRAFLRLDMCEFSQPHSGSKLIGAPAGYVGYSDQNQLADHVKQYPHSVILFDEIEKAHPDVLHLLMQILDHGTLTDGQGRKIDFQQSIVILTSNLGSELHTGDVLGFGTNGSSELQTQVRSQLEQRFSAPLINRLQSICHFAPLNDAALKQITRLQLLEMQARFSAAGIRLDVDTQLYKHITAQINRRHGARDILRVIEQDVESTVTKKLLERHEQKRHRYRIDTKEKQVRIRVN